MRRFSPYRAEPDPDDGFLARLRASAADLLARNGRRRQAMPLERFRGQGGPVVPYHERRQQLGRARRQHSSYALGFVVVLLVLVLGIFYGLTWALGGVFGGGSPRPTATAISQPTAPAAQQTTPPPQTVTLPTPAPGGSSPSPSPAPASTAPPGTQPTAGSGTPAPGAPGGRTYTVKPGDTPSTIARQFNISTEALMAANKIADARSLPVGQTLTIPPDATPTSGPR